MFNFGRLRWALRKVSLPVSGTALVLDVGSGGKPHTRADVLLDRPGGAEHRCGLPLIVDRPTVYGDAECLPFKDKSFDFVIAAHILEHMERPAAFLSELQRVGHAGYIETPNFLFERMIPYDIHCLEVASVNGTLHIHKKTKPTGDDFIGSLEFLKNDKKWRSLFFKQPHLFHTCHYWTGSIEYKIHNDGDSTSWIQEIYQTSKTTETASDYIDGGWRGFGQRTLNHLQRIRRAERLKKFNIHTVLACPTCHGNLVFDTIQVSCEACGARYRNARNFDFTESILS